MPTLSRADWAIHFFLHSEIKEFFLIFFDKNFADCYIFRNFAEKLNSWPKIITYKVGGASDVSSDGNDFCRMLKTKDRII